jgi:hypothetical protein
VTVPIRWRSLEHQSENLISTAYGQVSKATFHHRATRDVLAQSLLITDHAPGTPYELHLELVFPHLADGSRWLDWCSARLTPRLAELPAAGRELAHKAWCWLPSDAGLMTNTMPPTSPTDDEHTRQKRKCVFTWMPKALRAGRRVERCPR